MTQPFRYESTVHTTKVVNMPSHLNRLAKTLQKTDTEISQCEHIETKLAQAIVLSHLIPIDGVILEAETERLTKLAARRFGVSRKAVKNFIDLTDLNQKSPIPLKDLLSQIRKNSSYKQQLAFIRDLWDIALSDENLHSMEETMIYNVADQLQIERRDVISQQVRVCN